MFGFRDENAQVDLISRRSEDDDLRHWLATDSFDGAPQARLELSVGQSSRVLSFESAAAGISLLARDDDFTFAEAESQSQVFVESLYADNGNGDDIISRPASTSVAAVNGQSFTGSITILITGNVGDGEIEIFDDGEIRVRQGDALQAVAVGDVVEASFTYTLTDELGGSSPGVFEPEISASSITGSVGRRVGSAEAGSFSGTALAGLGDVNADGADDFAVGAYLTGADDRGAVTVYLGASAGTLSITGASAGDLAGISVSAAGDVDGDGVEDILVGAYRAAPGGRVNAGTTALIYGDADIDDINLGNLSAAQGFLINGDGTNDYSGFSVASAGDYNNDGYSDILVGAWPADVGSTFEAGEVYVVYGGPSRLGDIDVTSLDGSNGFKIEGVSLDDRLGFSVDGLGDVDGDGIDDFVVGVLHADPSGLTDAGEALVFLGGVSAPSATASAADADFVLQGAAAGDRLGRAVSSAGDVNGDGIDDILVGAFQADGSGGERDVGRAYVVYGQADLSGTLSAGSLDGSNGFEIVGLAADDWTGLAVSDAGDLNADGIDDIVIGAHLAGNDDAGAAYVVFGREEGFGATVDLAALDGTNGFVVVGAGPQAYLGFAVDAAGDINSDGVDDVIIGAFGEDNNAGAAYILYGRATASPISSTATVTITIEGENDAPVATDDTYSVLESVAEVSGNVLTNDTDIDNGDTLTVTAVQDASGETFNPGDIIDLSNGEIIVSANGEFTYTTFIPAGSVPDGVLDMFSYTVSDGLETGTGFVEILYVNENSSPIAENDAAEVFQSDFVVIDVVDNDVDPDGDPLIVDVFGATGDLDIINNGDGTLDISPDPSYDTLAGGEETTEDIFYTVTDPDGAFDDASVTVTIIGLNDAPTAINDSLDISAGESITVDLLANDFDIDRDVIAGLIYTERTEGFADIAVEYIDGGQGTLPRPYGSLGSGFPVPTPLTAALSSNSNFVSLSTDTSLTVQFVNEVVVDGVGNDLALNEFINAGEQADVYVSSNGTDFSFLGTATGSTSFDLASINFSDPVTHVRMIGLDTIGGSPGSDLVSVQALNFETVAALSIVDNGDGTATIDTGTTFSGLAAGETVSETLAYEITDPDGLLDVGVVEITITGTGGASPTVQAVSDSFTLNLGSATQLSNDVTLNDVRPAGEPIISVNGDSDAPSFPFTLPSGAIVTMNADGTFAYDENDAFSFLSPGENTYDFFSYTLAGGADGPPPIQTVDESDGIFRGQAGNDEYAGKKTLIVPDINGDGIDDILIAAPGHDYGNDGTNNGIVYVVFGTNTGIAPDLNLGALDGTNGFIFVGSVPNGGPTGPTFAGGGFGGSLASGDVNGDGLEDIIVGAPNYYFLGQGSVGHDAVYVLFGRNSGFSALEPTSGLDGANGYQLTTANTGGSYGYAGLGNSIGTSDFNGDGIDDIVIGAPNYYDPAEYSASFGRGFVVFGTDQPVPESRLVESEVAANNGIIVKSGGVAFDGLGTAVAGVGDINGDGFEDVIVGAPQTESATGSLYHGAATVIFGADGLGGITFDTSFLSAVDGVRVTNDNSGNRSLGYDVRGIGDFNGDGFDDVAISMPSAETNGVFYNGEVLVLFGADTLGDDFDISEIDGKNGFIVEGRRIAENSFGTEIAAVGDVNGDGFDDLAAFAPTSYYNDSSGEAVIIFGTDQELPERINVRSLDGVIGQSTFLVESAGVFTSIEGIGGGGDINGDGNADLLVADSFAGISGADAREGYVVAVTDFDNGDNRTASVMIEVLDPLPSARLQGNQGQQWFGTIGADNVAGTEFGDTLVGDAGDDVIAGGAGSDILVGDANVDVGALLSSLGLPGAQSQASQPVSTLSATNDFWFGSSADNVVLAGSGADTVVGAGGSDQLVGGAGGDLLLGDAHTDVQQLFESLGLQTTNTMTSSPTQDSDLLYGTMSGDAIDGVDGDDFLFGRGGGDVLSGGSGDDVIAGDFVEDVDALLASLGL